MYSLKSRLISSPSFAQLTGDRLIRLLRICFQSFRRRHLGGKFVPEEWQQLSRYTEIIQHHFPLRFRQICVGQYAFHIGAHQLERREGNLDRKIVGSIWSVVDYSQF